MRIDFHTHIFPDFIRDDRARFFANEPASRCCTNRPNPKWSAPIN